MLHAARDIHDHSMMQFHLFVIEQNLVAEPIQRRLVPD